MKRKFGFILMVTVIMALFAMPAMAANEIGDFAALQSAFATGGTYKLTANIIITEKIATSKDLTIDLNGKTISADASVVVRPIFVEETTGSLTVNDSGATGQIICQAGLKGTPIVIQKGASCILNGGTITGDDTCFRVIGNNSKESGVPINSINSTLTVNKGATISTAGKNAFGVFVYGKGATLNFNSGTIDMTGEAQVGIGGNGNSESGGTIINIKGGTVKTADTSGGIVIYHPQEGVLNITGGEFYGYDGIQFKGGTLNMSAGTITTTGEKPETLSDDSNGSVDTGAAISFVSNKNYAGNMKLNISGTAKLISSASYAIWEDTSVGDNLQPVSVNISGGNFSGTVAGSADVMYFKNRANISDFAVTGGTYNSDPKEYLKAGYVAVKSGDVYVVQQEKAKPVDPILPGVPAVVTPVSADKVVVVSVDINLKGEKKKAAEEKAATDTATKITTGGIASADLTVNETGKVVVKPEVVEKAIKSVELPKNEVLDTANIVPLPVVEATISAGQVAAITFEVTAKELQAKKAGDVKLFKVISADKGEFFTFIAEPASADDKMFALQAAGITSSDFLSVDAAIETGKSYRLTMFVKDGGSFDLNTTSGKVVDPAQLVATKTVTPSSGGSSSGCNAGFAALALLALVPVIYRRKK